MLYWASHSLFAFAVLKRKLALQLNSLIRVSRRAHLRCWLLDKFRRFALSVVEFFSSFVHTTCTLSVSLQYLALDGAYHPTWGSNLKLPDSLYGIILARRIYEAWTLYRWPFPGQLPAVQRYHSYISNPCGTDYAIELFSLRSPLLRES